LSTVFGACVRSRNATLERVALALALAIDGRGRAKKEGDVPIRNRGMTRRDSHDVAVKRGKEEVLGHPLRIQKNKYLGQF
jgi:hypothetical protein